MANWRNSKVNDPKSLMTAAQLLVDGQQQFVISGGPISLHILLSQCVVGGDAQAAHIRWNFTPLVGTAGTITGASGSLANAPAGTTVRLNSTGFATVPDIGLATDTGGVAIGANVANEMIIPEGTLSLTITGGPTTTGTWRHHLRYEPLCVNVTVRAVTPG